MKQKLFLTSAVAMGFVAPAIAEPSHTGTFPSTGLMEADYTYTNAATETNMGVYEGSVDAEAQYEDVLYQIAVGKYLPANSETTIDCDQNGYFCPGDNNGVYYSSSAQGLTQCPSGYGNTANGASANTDCYRTCTNADVEHSTGTVNGGYYYGDNNQCEPTACVNGWHVKPGLDLATIIGTSGTYGTAYVKNDGTFKESGNYKQSFFGIYDANTWAGYYSNSAGVLTGQARCSTQSGQSAWDYTNNIAQTPTIFESLTDEGGQSGALYCYCNVTSYRTYSGEPQSVSSSWVFAYANNNPSLCVSSCPDMCASMMQNVFPDQRAFSAALFSTVTPKLASCEANVITITWGDTDLADVTANEAGTATYGSDIRTPVKAQTKAGKRFTGWRFVAPTPVQSGN